MVQDEESKQKLIVKANTKRDMYRVLGKDTSDIQNEVDPQIYNDHEFYQQLLSDFL